VIWGLKWGLYLAIGCVLVVLAQLLVLGSEPLPEYVPPLPTLIAVYAFAAAVGGTILGLLRPAFGTLAGRLAGGVLVATAVYAAIGWSQRGTVRWTALPPGIIVGLLVGYYSWRRRW
jgi:hypothetical protein